MTSGPAVDDIARYERQLRLRALEHAGAATDPGLASILDAVRDRRLRRAAGAGPEGAVPASPVTPVAPVSRVAETAAPPVSGGAPGEVLAVQDVGPTVRILRVGRPPGLRFEAGQYLRLGVDDRARRKFSIASAPHEAHLEFCIELIPGGQVTPRLFALRPGDRVVLGDAPKGRFLLAEGAGRHLMVATGTGIAPLRSMLRDALHRGVTNEVVVLLGASYVDELPYHDELTALAAADPRVTYVATISRPTEARNAGWTGRAGRVDPLAVELAATLDPRTTHAYACGNGGMVGQVGAALSGAGFPMSSETY